MIFLHKNTAVPPPLSEVGGGVHRVEKGGERVRSCGARTERMRRERSEQRMREVRPPPQLLPLHCLQACEQHA